MASTAPPSRPSENSQSSEFSTFPLPSRLRAPQSRESPNNISRKVGKFPEMCVSRLAGKARKTNTTRWRTSPWPRERGRGKRESEWTWAPSPPPWRPCPSSRSAFSPEHSSFPRATRVPAKLETAHRERYDIFALTRPFRPPQGRDAGERTRPRPRAAQAELTPRGYSCDEEENGRRPDNNATKDCTETGRDAQVSPRPLPYPPPPQKKNLSLSLDES